MHAFPQGSHTIFRRFPRGDLTRKVADKLVCDPGGFAHACPQGSHTNDSDLGLGSGGLVIQDLMESTYPIIMYCSKIEAHRIGIAIYVYAIGV